MQTSEIPKEWADIFVVLEPDGYSWERKSILASGESPRVPFLLFAAPGSTSWRRRRDQSARRAMRHGTAIGRTCASGSGRMYPIRICSGNASSLMRRGAIRFIGCGGDGRRCLARALAHRLSLILEPDLDAASRHTEPLRQLGPLLGGGESGPVVRFIQNLELLRICPLAFLLDGGL